jgi:hypothetical protein
MIISMTLFIGALIFIFVFINPFSSKNQEKVSYIKNIESNLLKNLTTSVGQLSVIIDPVSNPDGCYDFNENDYPKVNYIEIKDPINTKRVFIYFSDIFESKNAPNKGKSGKGKSGCKKNDGYNLSSFSQDNYVVYERIKSLADGYKVDYIGLGKSLGITRDFSFSVKKLDGNLITGLSVDKKSPEWIEKESEDIPLIVINKNAQIQELVLNLKVW